MTDEGCRCVIAMFSTVQFRAQVRLHRPADDASRVHVEDDRQVQKTGPLAIPKRTACPVGSKSGNSARVGTGLIAKCTFECGIGALRISAGSSRQPQAWDI
jgi:hypothetical protein